MSASANTAAFSSARRADVTSITFPRLASVSGLAGSSSDQVVLAATASGLVTVAGGAATAVGAVVTSPTMYVGKNGATNPALSVIDTAVSAATGVSITGAAAGSNVAVAATSSGTNELMTIDAKGTGTLALQSSASGAVTVHASSATTAGGAPAALTFGVANVGITWGSGVPSSTAAQGSLYLRTDGSSTSTRLYVATATPGTWTAVTTAT